MVLLFWIFLLLVVYVYFGYPLLLTVLGYFSNKSVPTEEITPPLTLFIPVYNEEKVIRQKIENSLNLDYPKEKLEILVASDASSDASDAIVKEYLDKGVVFFRQDSRGGKNSLINRFMSRTTGEIVVFTDANSMFEPNSLKELVKGFADETVGCVCGRLKYLTAQGTSVGKGEGLYFRYEAYLRAKESLQGGVVTASGAIYAIRAKLFSPLALASPNDFIHPIEIKAKGYKVLYEPQALALEKPSETTGDEFKRRARIVTRGLNTFHEYNKRYNLLTNSNAFYFVSHKLLRWFLPLLLLGLFAINLTLTSPGYKTFLVLQVIFYLSGLLGFFLQEAGKKIKFFYVPFYFCLLNLAALMGLIRFYRGKREIAWNVAASTR